jgi:hypothetical protein
MKREYIPITVVAVLFGIAFLGSIWFETLRPLIQAGDRSGLLFNLVGLPIIVAGLVVFVYGGYRCLRDMFDLAENETFQQHATIIRERPSVQAVRASQRIHLRLWAGALGRGMLWMLLGFVCFAIGGYIINV